MLVAGRPVEDHLHSSVKGIWSQQASLKRRYGVPSVFMFAIYNIQCLQCDLVLPGIIYALRIYQQNYTAPSPSSLPDTPRSGRSPPSTTRARGRAMPLFSASILDSVRVLSIITERWIGSATFIRCYRLRWFSSHLDMDQATGAASLPSPLPCPRHHDGSANSQRLPTPLSPLRKVRAQSVPPASCLPAESSVPSLLQHGRPTSAHHRPPSCQQLYEGWAPGCTEKPWHTCIAKPFPPGKPAPWIRCLCNRAKSPQAIIWHLPVVWACTFPSGRPQLRPVQALRLLPCCVPHMYGYSHAYTALHAWLPPLN